MGEVVSIARQRDRLRGGSNLKAAPAWLSPAMVNTVVAGSDPADLRLRANLWAWLDEDDCPIRRVGAQRDILFVRGFAGVFSFDELVDATAAAGLEVPDAEG